MVQKNGFANKCLKVFFKELIQKKKYFENTSQTHVKVARQFLM